MKIAGVLITLLMAFGVLGGLSCGDAAALEMPGPCYGLEIEAGEDSITISGSFPENYHAAEISGAHIYRGLDPGNLTLVHTLKVYTDTSRPFLYRDIDISNGITYYYSVAAFNELGEGERSEVLSAMCIGTPPAPQGLIASVTCTHVHLCWSTPVSDGGSPIMYYSVFRGQRGGELVLLANVTEPYYDDMNVTFDDSFYNYQVCAVNEYGAGKRSKTVFASLPMPVVTGRLTDTDGVPVAGATVEVDTVGTVAYTDPNGTFSIAMTPGPHTLVIYVDGNAVHRLDMVTPTGLSDLGNIPIDEHRRAARLEMETIAMIGVIAIVTAAMVLWATGKAKIR